MSGMVSDLAVVTTAVSRWSPPSLPTLSESVSSGTKRCMWKIWMHTRSLFTHTEQALLAYEFPKSRTLKYWQTQIPRIGSDRPEYLHDDKDNDSYSL